MTKVVSWVGVCTLAVALLAGSPMATAEGGSDLEQRILQLEKQNELIMQQNAELRQQIQALMSEFNDQKEEVKKVSEETSAAAAAAGQISEFVRNTDFGGDFRLRGVMFDNFWNFDTAGYDDSWEFYRMRTRLWLNSQVTDDIQFYFRLANEYRWGDDLKSHTLLPDTGNLDEAIGRKDLVLDNAYIEWAEPFGYEPLTLRIGRQDLIYGEGFMILDGQDNVGSFLIAFDGAKASLDLREGTKLDLFGMKVEEQGLNVADDEDLFGAYLTDTAMLEDHKIELYALHRNSNARDDYMAGAIKPPLHTTALGGRLSGSFLDKALSYAIEGNYQFGEIQEVEGTYFAGYTAGDDIDRRAYGGYLWGRYTFLDTEWQPYIKLAGMFTSGDDPDSSDYEGFDTFYSDWPKWSEGYIYQLYDPFNPLKGGTDPDLGSWTNMIIARAEVGAKPMQNTDVMLAYQRLWADEDTGLGDDEDRGDQVLGILKYQINKNLSTHLLGEYFWPDDYYPDDADEAFFARWQMMLTF